MLNIAIWLFDKLRNLLRDLWRKPAARRRAWKSLRYLFIGILFVGAVTSIPTGCMTATKKGIRTIETTAYCSCGSCNDYVRGNWKYLKLDQWNRYLTYGPDKGELYTGRTAGGGWLQPPRPGLFSVDSIKKPYMIPVRIVFFPWLLLPQKGTIAADTRYYPFGTEMYIPGWGWGVVDDVGGAIKGPTRLDLYHPSHRSANRWGRVDKRVEIYYH
jgi:hypothetical protein